MINAIETNTKRRSEIDIFRIEARSLFIICNAKLGIKLISNICSIRGVPLIIALYRDIDSSDKSKPKGKANTSVTVKRSSVRPKPSSN